MEELIVLGCGGHARSVADTVERQGRFRLAGFVGTQQDAGFRYRGYGMLGLDSDLPALFAGGIQYAFLGLGYLGNSRARDALAARLEAIGFQLPVIADPAALVAVDAAVGPGTFVGKGAVVNAAATVGRCAIINTGAVVEHDCRVGAFAHIAVGAVLCGGVSVGDHVLIGAGATVLQDRTVGAGAIVGAGSVVLADLPAGVTAVGVIK